MGRIFSAGLLLFLLSAAGFGWDSSVKVAVLDIENRTKSKQIDSATLAELLQTELVKQNAFTIVERAYLSKVLEEQKLQMSGVTESDAVKIGSLAGAKKIITGSLSEIAGKYMLLIKVIDTSSGAIEIMEDENGQQLEDIIHGLPDLAYRIARDSRGENSTQTPAPQKEEPIAVPMNPTRPAPVGQRYMGFFPFQFAFVGGIQLVPSDFLITGVAIDVISGYDKGVYGLQCGFMPDSGEMFGSQSGFINKTREKMYGIQAGFINNANGEMFGLQTGFINNGGKVKGAQIGFINTADTLQGVQIGLINNIRHAMINFMPIINIGF